jgi:hypothetical protein
MTSWDFSGLFQKSGSEITFSSSSNWAFLRGASKIAPHRFGLLAELIVLPLDFFEGHKLPVYFELGGMETGVNFSTTGL